MLTVTLNPSVDVSAGVAVVEPERKLHCGSTCREPGGGGVNVARVVRVLGGDVTALVLVGGCSGAQLLDLLARQGLATEAIPIAEETRESLTVLDGATGRQYRFVMPGPTVTEEELAAAEARIDALARHSSLVVLSGSLPPNVPPGRFGSLVERIRSTGPAVIVDTSGDALGAAASAGTLVMKPSVRELSTFAGHALPGEPEVVAAAHDLLDRGPNEAVVVSLGAAGALLVRPDAPAVRVHGSRVHALSTVGAGDSLVGAMAVALERGADMEAAVCRGVAAGTAATLAHGTGLCRREDVERLLPHVSVHALAFA
jgi:6-phosphofructokinase 2